MESSLISDNDFVTVEMPIENESGSGSVAMIVDEEALVVQNQSPEGREDDRSLLKTLWSEATSTTDLPPPIKDHKLHHRRTTTNKTSPNSIKRKSSLDKSPSKGKKSDPRGGRHANRYRTRGARIAKRVWLTAFAAFAAAILISIHVYLYRVLMGSSTGSDSIDTTSNLNAVIGKHGQAIISAEDQQIKMTLSEAHAHRLTDIHIHPIDTTQFTIRINTWQRNEQLLLSLNHHSQCTSVAEIQVIWCDTDNEPPDEVLHHASNKVKIERHSINSLNERFKVLLDPPTLAILSLDDDVLRPCVALDTAFIRWTRHPERMVGFDVRSHVIDEENNGKWKYGYMSTTESSNKYSMTLPRASFIHRDYLDIYIMAVPRQIYSYVAQNLECEDIAMSFLVSSLTDGKPPLIADYWAVKSMIKLYSEKKISGGKDHKSTRDSCVNNFADLLGLKKNTDGKWPLHDGWPLQYGKVYHNSFFGYGTEPEDWSTVDVSSIQLARLQNIVKKMQELQSQSNEERMYWLVQQKAEATKEAKRAGMIEKTDEWKKRWGK